MRTKNRKEDKMDTREEFVGKFELGNKVDITDPCYNKGTRCRMTTDCRPGTWYGYATISDEGEWGDRVAMLCIYLEDHKDVDMVLELIGNIGVDAGMAEFFRDKPDYTDEEWYQFCSQFDHRKRYTGLDYGVVSESGYGDGGYDVYANADRSAFMIEFLYDDEEE